MLGKRAGGWPLWKSATVAVVGCLATVGLIGGVVLWLLASSEATLPAGSEPVRLALPALERSDSAGPTRQAPNDERSKIASPPALGGGAAISAPAASATAFAGIPFLPPSPALAPAPVAGLYEETQAGRLPVIAADGRAPRTAYAKPFTPPAGAGLVALVILDAGLSPVATEAAIYRLPSTVTLAFSVYSDSPQRWVDQARQAGHEALLALPFRIEPIANGDLGPLAITADLAVAERTRRLRRILSAAVGYVGLVGDLRQTFSDSPETVTDVVGGLLGRGLLYLEAGGPDGLATSSVTQKDWVKRATAVVTVDAGPAEIDALLAALEETARREGRAIGLAFATPLALERITTWAAASRQRSWTLAPVSAVVSPEPS